MISLIVPVFNMEKLLPRCMKTLLMQTGDFEIILVNDGSTDSSGVLCDQYRSQYPALVKVIHKNNGGLSSARNAGIDAAQGEYITFPDPDDWVEPNLISRFAQLQKQYNYPDLLCIGYYIDYDAYFSPANKECQLQQMDGKQAQRALLIPPCINGFAWNKLYSLNIVRSHHLKFRDDVGTTEDLAFAFHYLQYCKRVVFSPEDRLYHYYQRSGAATHSNFSKGKLSSIKTYEEIMEASDDELLIRAAKEEICNAAINFVWAFKCSNHCDKDSWKKIRQYLNQYFLYYCTSRRYGIGRKIQMVLAYCTPGLYAKLKGLLHKDF